MGFGIGFQKGVTTGIPQGLQMFLSNKKTEASALKEQEKKKLKLKQRNDEVVAQSELLGVDFIINEDTREYTLDVEEDIDLSGIPQSQRLKFLPETGGEFQSIFKQMEKEAEPEDFFVNKRVGMNAEGEGAVFAVDNNPESETFGSEIEIGKAPNYQFRTKDETFFDGVIEFEGQKIGIEGKRSKLIQYENGKFDIIQGVSDIKESKSIEKQGFESKMSKVMQDKTKALERYEDALDSGADERILETKRERINSDLNRVAWDSYELGTEEAKAYMKELYEEGRHTINKGFEGMPDTRLDYFQRKHAEVIAQVGRGEWSFEDETAIFQFLRAKYESFVVSVDPIKDANEFILDIPEFQMK
jgi:hypothetical protein